MYLPNLKSVALPVPEIRGGSKVANPQSRGRGSHKGSGMVLSERALMNSYRPSIHIFPLSALVCPKCYRLQFSVGVANPNFGGRGGRRGSGMVPFERAFVSFYRSSIFSSTFMRFRDITVFVLHATFPLPHLPQISLWSPGSRWIAFWLQWAKVLG